MNMNKKSISISIPRVPLPALLGLVVAIALFATGLNASSLLPGQPPSALASYSVEQTTQRGQGAQPKQGTPLNAPAGSAFTYQGSLKSGGTRANGLYDFQFSLYDALSAGNLVGSPLTQEGVAVTDGLFTVSLNFGPTAFDGNARYLEIAVRQSGGGSYSLLSPRQEITPSPYALFALKTAPYKNVVSVAQSGGQYTSVQAALNSITDNSTTNRYLVRVGPGTYTERVTMKQYVDIEGSGEKTTKITFVGGPDSTSGTVIGASNAELRSLTVENTGGNTLAIAINNSPASPSLLHVTAITSGTSSQSFGVFNAFSSPILNNMTIMASGGSDLNAGVYNETSSTSMNNLTVTASGPATTNWAVENLSNSSPNMTNMTATASGASVENAGVYNQSSTAKIVTSIITASGGIDGIGVSGNSGTVTIDSSKISGSTRSIFNNPGATIRVGTSQLSGGPAYNGGTLTCSASYDGNNKRLGSLCTPDTKTLYVALTGGDFTTITAALNSISDNSFNNRYLIKVAPGNYIERVTMKQYVDIEGSGENETRIGFTGSPLSNTGTVLGASNAELRSLTIENSGVNNYAIAIYNNGASPSLVHVTAIASGGGSTNYGVYNSASSPRMLNVTANASGGSNAIAVANALGSSPNMANVTATASGATSNNFGVTNSSSSPNMTSLTAAASGPSGSSTTGVQNIASSPIIVTSIISASGGSNNYGIYGYNGGTVKIDNSKITGSTNTVYGDINTIARVGASQLSGGPVTGPTTCTSSYDENYVSPGLNVCP